MLEHHREGTGPPLVLLHGVGHHWQAWRPIIDRLAAEFDVVACDLPGFGRSAPLPPGSDQTIPAYTTAVEQLFAALALDRPHVAGNSMGGAIALELASRRTVRSATALSPAGFWTAAERRYGQASLGALARMPRPLRPALTRLAARPAGRQAVFAQLCAHGSRVPAD